MEREFFTNGEKIDARRDVRTNMKTMRIVSNSKVESDFRDFLDTFNYILSLYEDQIRDTTYGERIVVENVW